MFFILFWVILVYKILLIIFLYSFGYVVRQSCVPKLLPVLKMYQNATSGNKWLKIPFTTLPDYLWTLKGAAEVLDKHKTKAMLYLAAAVSDFYIPPSDMVCIKSCISYILTIKNWKIIFYFKKQMNCIILFRLTIFKL